ncbi:MobC family plasmid mobilization relaxosome protein [Mobilitalea sibirica]|uniref:MobC family plasmid mobilization relaxosome protein n=1 Tax=Mobilitalea sibirica TaxID=1462919 RepID=A0A8J7H4S6_9FIRM|nr:MobC family plasmid mobilization relaxosome protein [Mobilitalea sibirica]MBH1942540.1 MobC family plasmid mobilization relaxosome protein [Mobilitalea sibirica]
MNRSRPKQIVIRASESEYNRIKKKVERSTLTQNEYLLKCSLGKEIIVVEGIHELAIELKRIGNNLNQLTKAVHQGKANCSKELDDISKEMKEVWQLLRRSIQKQA